MRVYEGLKPESDKVLNALVTVFEKYSGGTVNIAFSGGIDSSVLLHAASALRHRYRVLLRALHVNHRWSTQSDAWQLHCESACRTLDVDFLTTRFADSLTDELPSETLARTKRLQWFAEVVDSRTPLLTAHHLDDQAETLLLRLLRGSGTKGLGGMLVDRNVGKLRILRPFLQLSRADLEMWAKNYSLQTINDPGNSDSRFERNFLRHEILPRLVSRWGGVQGTLSRAAGSFQATQGLLDEVGHEDLKACRRSTDQCLLGVYGMLSISALDNLSQARKLNLLRYWIRLFSLETASENGLSEFLRQLRNGASECAPVLRVGQCRLRRYRNSLFLLPGSPIDQEKHSTRRAWNASPTEIKGADIGIEGKITNGMGLKLSCLKGNLLELRWQKGNARLRPTANGRHRRVKQLFQESGIPPWERSRLPLVYYANQLACVPGVAIEHSLSASGDEPGIQLLISDLRIISAGTGTGTERT